MARIMGTSTIATHTHTSATALCLGNWHSGHLDMPKSLLVMGTATIDTHTHLSHCWCHQHVSQSPGNMHNNPPHTHTHTHTPQSKLNMTRVMVTSIMDTNTYLSHCWIWLALTLFHTHTRKHVLTHQPLLDMSHITSKNEEY